MSTLQIAINVTYSTDGNLEPEGLESHDKMGCGWWPLGGCIYIVKHIFMRSYAIGADLPGTLAIQWDPYQPGNGIPICALGIASRRCHVGETFGGRQNDMGRPIRI